MTSNSVPFVIEHTHVSLRQTVTEITEMTGVTKKLHSVSSVKSPENLPRYASETMCMAALNTILGIPHHIPCHICIYSASLSGSYPVMYDLVRLYL